MIMKALQDKAGRSNSDDALPSRKVAGSESRARNKPLVGRPRKTEVNPAIAKAICDNLEVAMPLDLAAEAEGVGRSTVRGWMNDYPEFSGRVTRARDGGEEPCSPIP